MVEEPLMRVTPGLAFLLEALSLPGLGLVLAAAIKLGIVYWHLHTLRRLVRRAVRLVVLGVGFPGGLGFQYCEPKPLKSEEFACEF